MMRELTERQREILEYAKENGRVAAVSHFSLSLSQVNYIVYKNNKLNKQKKETDGQFLKITPSQILNHVSSVNHQDEDKLTFTLDGIKISMTVCDFRKAFFHD